MSTQTADIIEFPVRERQHSDAVIRVVASSVEHKMEYLFEGLLVNASEAVFEEMWAAEQQEALARQFNVLRFLKLNAGAYKSCFNRSLDLSLRAMSRGASFQLTPPQGPVAELVTVNSRRINNHYKVITREVEQRLSTLTGGPVRTFPLTPVNFYAAFWQSTLQAQLTYHERFMLMILFQRFVMDRYGQVLAVANNALIDQRVQSQIV